MKIQDERISVLEKRPKLSDFRSTVELQEKVQRQNDRIVELETRISKLEVMVTDSLTFQLIMMPPLHTTSWPLTR